MFFVYVPWAFASILELVEKAGEVIKIITGSLSVGLAVAALAIQVRALGRANAFMSKYAAVLPGFKPLWFQMTGGSEGSETRAWLAKTLFATPWDPLM